jgi:hypothetical protein
MRIDELFDSQYTLIRANHNISTLIKQMLTDEGFQSIIVYEAKEDSKQIFMIAYIDEAWEVHHTFAEPGKNFVSGEILGGNRTANPKFIGTSIRLYQSKLDKAHSIRVVAFPEMWSTYERVITRLADNTRYEKGRVKDIIRDGHILKSQEIRLSNKFEGLKNKKVPVLENNKER